MKAVKLCFKTILFVFACMGAYVLGSALSQARAESYGDLYHGIDGFHSSTDFRSSTKRTINFKSFGGSPFIGVHLNNHIAIEGGYIYHKAESSFTLVGQRATPMVLVGRKYTSVRDSVAHLIAGYSIQGPHLGIKFTSGKYKEIPIRFYFSAALFPSFIKVQFRDQAPQSTTWTEYAMPPVELPKVFTRLSIGATWDITEQVSFRGAVMLLRPERVNLEHYNNFMFRQLKNYTHMGIGLHYNWK